MVHQAAVAAAPVPHTASWRKYFWFNTDHKVIGLQYLTAAFVFLLIGVALAMIMRAELMAPGMQVVKPGLYNGIITMHGTIMIFLWLIPVLVGLGNYITPLMIGAADMAFPRLNALSFWLFLAGSLLILSGLLVGPAAAGWTSYATLSIQGPLGQTFWIIGLIINGTATIVGAINFMVTIWTMRAPGMTLWRMPLFCWSLLATVILILMSTPVLTAGLFMQLFDRVFGTVFFAPGPGGDPILWQHLFWFYSHPAVYIMVLPGMGVISEVVSTFSRKPVFGYKMVAVSSLAIAFLSLLVWAHHMFTSGAAPIILVPMMITSMLVAVPTGVKIFSWLGTMWEGKLWFRTPMLFVFGFISQFVIAGITGVMQASIPLDLHFQDTYFLVAHLHFALFGSAVFAALAGVYYWFPKITGHMYNEKLGAIHFYLALVAFNLTFLPMFWLGLNGMPRRVADYIPEFAGVNFAVSIAGFVLGFSFLLCLYNIITSWIWGPRAEPNPWRALGLEWRLPSPVPEHNWGQPPEDVTFPYDYGRGLIPPNTEPLSGESVTSRGIA